MKPVEGRKRVIIEEVQPQVDCGRYPAKRILGDSVTVTAAVFGDGHDHVSGRLLYRHSSESAWRSTPLTASHQRPLVCRLHRGQTRRLALHHRGLGRSLRHMVRRSAKADRRPKPFTLTRRNEPVSRHSPRPALRCSPSEAGRATRSGLRRQTPHTGSSRSQSLGRERHCELRLSAKRPDDRPRRTLSRPQLLYTLQTGSPPLGRPRTRPLLRLVRTLPPIHLARPNSTRHLRRRQSSLAHHRRHGLRRPLSAADPPHRQRLPQGPQQQRHLHARRPRQPMGHRLEGGRPQIHPRSARHSARLRFTRRCHARPRHGTRPRHRLPVLARSPLGHRASRLVHHSPRWLHPVRRKPAKKIPGHLSTQLRIARLARPLGGPPRCLHLLDSPQRPHLPRRQPPHQGPALLGVVHRRDPQKIPRRHLPRRSLHPPARHVLPRQGRLHPVLHLLHLAQHPRRAAGVLRRDHQAANLRLLPPQPLAQHARHPPRHAPERRPQRLQAAPHPRRNARRELRHLRPSLRAMREPPRQTWQRRVSQQRKV